MKALNIIGGIIGGAAALLVVTAYTIQAVNPALLQDTPAEAAAKQADADQKTAHDMVFFASYCAEDRVFYAKECKLADDLKRDASPQVWKMAKAIAKANQ